MRSLRLLPRTCWPSRRSLRQVRPWSHPLSTNSNDNSNNIVVYQTSKQSDRRLLLRTGIGFSSFHTAYWIWYNTDFIPAVNASTMPELHIDPMLGVAGLVFGIAIQAVFFLYPRRLVSSMAYQPATQQVAIATHDIPWVRPAKKPKLYQLGQVWLDPASPDTSILLDRCDGNLQVFRGHLGLSSSSTKWPPLLLDIRSVDNVPEPELLLDLLLTPERLKSTKKQPRAPPRQDSKLRKISRRRR